MGRIIGYIIEITAVLLLYPTLFIGIIVSVCGYVLYKFNFLIAFYVIWYFVSRNYGSQGGRRIQGLRDWQIWKYYANYFPINLIKTTELNANKNYLCGFHPHGYFAWVTINFFTEATGFSSKFPNLRSSLIELHSKSH